MSWEKIARVEVSWDEVRARRLARSWLTDRASAGQLVEVVSSLCGVQAQLQTAAELQLAARIDGLTQADVREAVWEQRALIKAWTLRGTLHLHPAGELPLWHAARRAVAPAGEGLPAWRDPARVLHPALGPAEVEAVRAAVWEALDGRRLSRDELAEAVVERVGAAARARLFSGFAFFHTDLCQGPPRGARITLVRPDQWIEGSRDVDGREALREVCRRFLRTYGPPVPPTSSGGSAPERSRPRSSSTSSAPNWRRSRSTAAAPSSWPVTGRSPRKTLGCGCYRSTTST